MRSARMVDRRISCGRWFLGVVAVLVAIPVVTALARTPVVFVSRSLETRQDIVEQQPGRSDAIVRASRGILVLVNENGVRRVLVDSGAANATPKTPTDVMDPDVSYDAQTIVFSGYVPSEKGWRIFTVNMDGSDLRQLTTSDREVDLTQYGEAAPALERYDDLDPIFLPDGRICCVSTRYPGIAPDHRKRSTNLYVMNSDGSDLSRITTERFGADTPAINPTNGQIVYSRWWRTAETASENPRTDDAVPPGSAGYEDAVSGNFLGIGTAHPDPGRGIDEAEFPGINSWFLASINPDGTGMEMFTGVRLDRTLTQAYRPSFMENGAVLSIFLPKTPILGFPRGFGLRLYQKGPVIPEALGGPQNFRGGPVFFDLMQEIPEFFPGGFTVQTNRESFNYEFNNAVPIPGDSTHVLTSAAPIGDKHYDLYKLNMATGQMTRFFRDSVLHDLDVAVALPRPQPGVIPAETSRELVEEAPETVGEAYFQGGTFRFQVENIHFQAPVDTPITSAPPVGQDLNIEFYMAPPGSSSFAADEAILIRSEKIPASGKLDVELPAGVPLFEILRRPDGLVAQGRDGQVFHVGGMNFSRSDKVGRCVGCHAGHTMMQVPEDATWTNLASSAVVTSNPVFPMRVGEFFPVEEILGPDGVGEDPMGPLMYGPEKLVDRRTEQFCDWSAGTNDRPAVITMKWPVALQARKVVVYSVRPGVEIFGPRNVTISRFTVKTSFEGEAVEEFVVTSPLQVGDNSQTVLLNAARTIDKLELTIDPRDVSGSFDMGGAGAALSEIEVEARVAPAAEESYYSFLRGDVNCDETQNIADPIAILHRLFAGGQPLCCDVAADTDDSGTVNIGDAISLLNYLFAGGAAPAAPSERCERALVKSGLGCAEESCR